MATSLLPVPAFANDQVRDSILSKESITMLETSEPSMPVLQNASTYTLNRKTETMSIPSREDWCEETEIILEETYNQEVSSISETSDFIIFELETEEDADITNEHVLMVKYVKPESTLAVDNYDTKFTYTWGWNRKYYSQDEKSGKWSRLQKLAIAIISGSDIPVIDFLSRIFSITSATIDSDLEVDVESLYKSYFLNETCSVKEPTHAVWLPYVNVGCRKDFLAGSCVVYDEIGQPMRTFPKQQEKEGIPSENPRNYDRYRKSTHFDDFNWMQNKAIQLFKIDGNAHNEVLGYPDNYHITDTKP